MRALPAIVALCGAATLIAGTGIIRSEIKARRAGEWTEARRDELVLGAEISGQLESAESSSLGPPSVADFWDFKISMMAPEGSDVKAGTPVLGFDTSELERQLEENKAESDSAAKEIERSTADLALRQRDENLKLAQAEANLRKSEIKLEAPPELTGRNERRQVEIEHRTYVNEAGFRRERLKALATSAAEQIQLVRARYETAARKVQQISANIRQMTVTAPRDGTVVYAINWRNEKKKVGDTTWVGEKIVEIPDLTRMRAAAEVDESDAGTVSLGQRATIRLDAQPDTEYEGRVISIGQTVQRQKITRSPVKVLTVRIALDHPDPSLMRPGMHFQGTLETARVRNALVIPLDALVNDHGKAGVEKRLRVGSTLTPVQFGHRTADLVEITSGLAAGDRVLRHGTAAESKND